MGVDFEWLASGSRRRLGLVHRRRDAAPAMILQHGDVAGCSAARTSCASVTACRNEKMCVVEARPQLVRHAAAVVAAVLAAAALGGVDRLVDGDDDVGDRDRVRRPGEVVAAAGTAHALDQAVRGAACRTAARGRTAKSSAARRRRPASPGRCAPCIATSIIAVTAKRPLVVSRMVGSFASAVSAGPGGLTFVQDNELYYSRTI